MARFVYGRHTITLGQVCCAEGCNAEIPPDTPHWFGRDDDLDRRCLSCGDPNAAGEQEPKQWESEIAKRSWTCNGCKNPIAKGDVVAWDVIADSRWSYCYGCAINHPPAPEQAKPARWVRRDPGRTGDVVTLIERPPSPGIWVWEGEAEYSPGGEYPGDCEPQYDGEWRRADPHELAQLARGEMPPMREFPARPWWMGMEGPESWEEADDVE